MIVIGVKAINFSDILFTLIVVLPLFHETISLAISIDITTFPSYLQAKDKSDPLSWARKALLKHSGAWAMVTEQSIFALLIIIILSNSCKNRRNIAQKVLKYPSLFYLKETYHVLIG